jgi:hypothetical protein
MVGEGRGDEEEGCRRREEARLEGIGGRGGVGGGFFRYGKDVEDDDGIKSEMEKGDVSSLCCRFLSNAEGKGRDGASKATPSRGGAAFERDRARVWAKEKESFELGSCGERKEDARLAGRGGGGRGDGGGGGEEGRAIREPPPTDERDLALVVSELALALALSRGK